MFNVFSAIAIFALIYVITRIVIWLVYMKGYNESISKMIFDQGTNLSSTTPFASDDLGAIRPNSDVVPEIYDSHDVGTFIQRPI